MNGRLRPLLALLLLLLLLIAALRMPGVRLPFVTSDEARPLPGMNQEECVAAGGHYDLILGCAK